MDICARLRARGGLRRAYAEVIDLSIDGCKVRSTEYNAGDGILITLAHLAPLPAHVLWVKDGAMGIQFATRLHPSVARHLASLRKS